MKTTRILWLKEFIEKLAVKHGVKQYEVDEVFAARPKIRFVKTGHYPGEDIYSAHGQTDA